MLDTTYGNYGIISAQNPGKVMESGSTGRMDTKSSPAFVGGKLHRDATIRDDPDAVSAMWSSGQARVTPLWRSRNLLSFGSGRARPGLIWLPVDHPFLSEQSEPPIFIGRNGTARLFSLDVSARDDIHRLEADVTEPGYPIESGAFRHPTLPVGSAFVDVRMAMTLLGAIDAESVAVSRALSSWHRSHGFCAACGEPSRATASGWQRHCPSCDRMHFPRTDPVVIMLVIHGNCLLMGRSVGWPDGMYSLLAGFMEPGETIEQAVRRETLEEAGVTVGAVRYLASQPWPFPASLMIGCRGEALNRDLRIDPEELDDAIWVSREEMARIFATGTGRIRPPRPGAIARTLTQGWLTGRF
ncbi:MAG: NAD(+) diphosphatase [Paracoccaceae bacterium]|nr:NAD(+) diphosphatase [Paracoccaceae bacterium]